MKILACLFLLSTITATVLGAYSCDPTTCKVPACKCASYTNPGGFAVNQTPLFVTLSFDGSVDDTSLLSIQPVLDAFAAFTTKDPAGCTPKTTFFLANQFTNFYKLTLLRATQPVEFAHNTITGNVTAVAVDFVNEILGSREYTNKLALIPNSELVGWRFPGLAYSNEGMNILATNSFLYDASLLEYAGAGNATLGNYLWPFTLDNGTPTNNDTGPVLTSHKGVWEIPIADLHARNGTPLFSQNPEINGTELSQFLSDNFNDHLNGNRSPFGIYITPDYLAADATRTTAIINFFKSIAGNPNVFFVTYKQLIAYSLNPTNIAATAASALFKCVPPAVLPNNTEICNGLDDNLNKVIDEGTINSCSYATAQFQTCGLCPINPPSTARNFTSDPPCNTPGVCKAGPNGNPGETCVNCPADCGACPIAIVPNTTVSSAPPTTNPNTIPTTKPTTGGSTPATVDTKPSPKPTKGNVAKADGNFLEISWTLVVVTVLLVQVFLH